MYSENNAMLCVCVLYLAKGETKCAWDGILKCCKKLQREKSTKIFFSFGCCAVDYHFDKRESKRKKGENKPNYHYQTIEIESRNVKYFGLLHIYLKRMLSGWLGFKNKWKFMFAFHTIFKSITKNGISQPIYVWKVV